MAEILVDIFPPIWRKSFGAVSIYVGEGFGRITVDYTANPTIPLVGRTGHSKRKAGENACDTLSGPYPRSTYRQWVIRECAPCGTSISREHRFSQRDICS